jgi:hypothetical protein
MKRARVGALLLVALALPTAQAPAVTGGRAAAVNFTVTSAADAGPGTLRQAIADANAADGSDTIQFNIPGPGPHTIALQTALPAVTSPVFVDGLTQPGSTAGSPKIVLDGSLAVGDGLVITAGSSRVRGLAIVRFGGDAIAISGGGSNVVESNLVGVDPTSGAPAGNGGDGVSVDSSGNRVGGEAGASANTIAHNGGAGVRVVSGTGNPILGNKIFSNGGLGIDLGPDGPTPNDNGDGDGGPNELQNAPVVLFVQGGGNILHVDVFLSTTPSTTVRVEFFTSHVGDPSGFGEGEARIGFSEVDTGPSGQIGLGIDFINPDPGRRFVTATATKANSTSEFSNVMHVELPPEGSDTPGVVLPASGAWFLRNANGAGPADLVFGYGPADPALVPLDGDWDGDGDSTPGLYDPSTGAFFLKNSNAGGPADLVFNFGAGGAGLRPLAGDWDGDGRDTVGLYDPSTGAFFLRNSNAPGPADAVFGYGPAGLGWVALSGDWDDDDVDTVALYDPSTGNFFLRNANSAGPADAVVGFGPGGLGWVPLAGDYDNDGDDTIGLYAPSSGTFFLRNANAPGGADLVFGYGPAGATPLVGNWDGQ